MTTTDYEFRLLDFNVSNVGQGKEQLFRIQMFGLNEKGETCCIHVDDFKPFFYVSVDETWKKSTCHLFVHHLAQKIRGNGETHEIETTEREDWMKDTSPKDEKTSISTCGIECELVERRKMYGFDGQKNHKFVQLTFANMNLFYKVKNLWYYTLPQKEIDVLPEKRLLKSGYVWQKTPMFLYEANIPPMLRFFHIQNISPSGWIRLPGNKTAVLREKTTTCTYEFSISSSQIVSLPDKETRVPYKICSFDIEASSSHGDFPLPVKTYKKLASQIMECVEKNNQINIKELVLSAFSKSPKNVDKVFPKKMPSRESLQERINTWWEDPVQVVRSGGTQYSGKMENYFDKEEYGDRLEDTELLDIDVEEQEEYGDRQEDTELLDIDVEEQEDYDDRLENTDFLDIDVEEQEEYGYRLKKNVKEKKRGGTQISILLQDSSLAREKKMSLLTKSLDKHFPSLEGDKVTFIGSTFLRYGENEPYRNHCIVLNTCATLPNAEIQICKTEKDVLIAWQELMESENPDIVIGYNIFGFDYSFLFERAKECECVEQFLKLSRNRDEICAQKKNGEYKLEENKLQIASGTHELRYIKMTGRLQIDLYNVFRREENLSSYKLDYVSGYFIGDGVKGFAPTTDTAEKFVKVSTGNLTGLTVGAFVHFEEIGNTTEYMEGGAKFKVVEINNQERSFTIQGQIGGGGGGGKSEKGLEEKETGGKESVGNKKKVRWCLAKDDVSPQDIFKMTGGTDDDRAVIAKYCLQDCNLVHHLLKKVDSLTGFIEMAKICSVPISFLVFRGQGIKSISFVAKKCREKGVLIPVIEKTDSQEGYEGAIVLPPKCGLYLDTPVACVDYASLYPSSMISENLSHDSKVWAKEYNLQGELVKVEGVQDKKTGLFVFDNLPGYTYVNVEYDTFKWVRKSEKAKAEKVIWGKRVCRFAQAQVHTQTDEKTQGILPLILEELLMARKATRKQIPKETDEFMKNVLDKRQLGYKLTANSLYGQCGAKTSAFYERDIAASTTATGRLLLTFAKRVIEECYGNTLCRTSVLGHEWVRTKSEYIYGDTDSVFFTFHLETPEGLSIVGKTALEITIELAQQAGHLASSFLKKPHDLEYEKTFMPFCLLAKKRYVGMLYETDVNVCKRKEMGIVLKRRDNAPIVKEVYGGIVDILMREQNIQKAKSYLRDCLQKMVKEEYPIEKLIISKSLRSGYKNPQSIAHKVLADRMTERDPGNKPSPGDRIPYVYIHHINKNALQGEKIENPTYILENKIKVDYSFYITNQIMKPVQQIFSLVIDRIILEEQGEKKRDAYVAYCRNHQDNPVSLETWKNKQVQAILFDDFLRETNNKKSGNVSITNFFQKTTTPNLKSQPSNKLSITNTTKKSTCLI